MRIIGNRVQYRVRAMPTAEALGAAAAHHRTAMTLAAVATTGMRRGIYRFASHSDANAHAEESLVRAIVENVRARKLVR